jgi:hypothetical protein
MKKTKKETQTHKENTRAICNIKKITPKIPKTD